MDPVDVDVVFYISGRDINHETLKSINDLIYALLIKIYPTKSVEDFEIQRKAATVSFVGSGLSVDIVPVIEDPNQPGYGWQFDIHDGSAIQTCAPCQIKFVRDRKNQDPDFRTLVRMAKKWRNHAGLKPLKSFVIELIMAHVLAQQGAGGTIEQRFRNFLLYIAQSGLKDEIRFPENVAPFAHLHRPGGDPRPGLQPQQRRQPHHRGRAPGDRGGGDGGLGDREFRLGRQRQRRLEGNLRASLQDGGMSDDPDPHRIRHRDLHRPRHREGRAPGKGRPRHDRRQHRRLDPRRGWPTTRTTSRSSRRLDTSSMSTSRCLATASR